jgi:hypothetical protein
MTLIWRGIMSFSGWEGGPGANVLHFSQGTPPVTADEMAQACLDELASLYGSLRNYILADVTITYPTEFSVIESTTGELQDVRAVTTPHADVLGAAGDGSLPRSTSVCVSYRTDQFFGGRRLIGRSYVGPTGTDVMDADGNISSTIRTTINGAYTALISGVGPRLAVYHRPTSVAAADGRYGDVVNVQTLALPSNLHSRRQ